MQLCDNDANGAEVAQYEVYLPKGKIMLCDHHMQAARPAMEKTGGIVALRIDAVADNAYGILTNEDDGISALDVTAYGLVDDQWQSDW